MSGMRALIREASESPLSLLPGDSTEVYHLEGALTNPAGTLILDIQPPE